MVPGLGFVQTAAELYRRYFGVFTMLLHQHGWVDYILGFRVYLGLWLE